MPRHVSLFRVVQRDELDDITAHRGFRTMPGSTSGKYFWTTRRDAERFRRLLLARLGIGPSWIVDARVPAEILQRLPRQRIDGRPAVFVDERELDDWFNGAVEQIVFDDEAAGIRE